MSLTELLKLEREHNERALNDRLQAARHKNQQELFNFGVFIISEQMKLNTLAMFAGLDTNQKVD